MLINKFTAAMNDSYLFLVLIILDGRVRFVCPNGKQDTWLDQRGRVRQKPPTPAGMELRLFEVELNAIRNVVTMHRWYWEAILFFHGSAI